VGKRSRTERREAEREAAKLARARGRLFALELGGAADRPIEVASASVVEPHASSMVCAGCGEQGLRVDEHLAVTGPDRQRLRVVHARCPRCGVRREVFFRIGTVLPS
jgi:hypothetical protein